MAIEKDLPDNWMERRQAQRAWPSNPLPAEDRDRARIIHSAAFRRLQTKTQVLGIGESDFHRTRLTHTMEVAQVGRVIAIHLASDARFAAQRDVIPSPALIEAVCLAHDLGHPPFGHCGETALDYAMRSRGGFEGNGQSLRIVGLLEPHTVDHGLNLTRRVLMGILKYPAPYSAVTRTGSPTGISLSLSEWKPPKCFLDSECDLVAWIVHPLSESDQSLYSKLAESPTAVKPGKTLHRSLDTSILNLADDIAYGIHDLEDGIALHLISKDSLEHAIRSVPLDWAAPFGVSPGDLVSWFFGTDARDGGRKKAVGALCNALVCSVYLQEESEFECPLLKYRATLPDDARRFLDAVIDLVKERIVRSQEVQTLEYRGMRIVSDLFSAISSDPRALLGPKARKQVEYGADPYRAVCDFIAGMTDVYANRFHERLYGSRQASVFERL
jgi:dGTPase